MKRVYFSIVRVYRTNSPYDGLWWEVEAEAINKALARIHVTKGGKTIQEALDKIASYLEDEG